MKGAAAAVAALMLTGCASSPPAMYAWGSYELMLYATYAAPGSVGIDEQIDLFENELSQAAHPMPPGWYAHLGYLYEQAGRLELARDAFLAEKADYPESTVLMDRFLQAMADAGPRIGDED